MPELSVWVESTWISKTLFGISWLWPLSESPWAIGGFLINAVTGALFLIMQPHLYLGSAVWWAKVAFIGIAGANAMFFETRLAVPALALDPEADTSTTMKVIGAVSLFSWFAVMYCGRMLPYLGTGN